MSPLPPLPPTEPLVDIGSALIKQPWYQFLTQGIKGYYNDNIAIPEDFGADGTTANDTKGIQAAIDSGAAMVLFLGRTYNVSDAGITGVSNQHWVGLEGATLQLQAAPVNGYFVYVLSKSDFCISNISFDGNGKLTAGVGAHPSLLPCLYVSSSSDFCIEDCEFTGFYNCGLLVNEVQRFRVKDNYVSRGSALNDPANSGLVVAGSTTADGLVDGNMVLFCNLANQGSRVTITRNTVEGWGFSGGINLASLSTCHDNVISFNQLISSDLGPDKDGYYMAGIENWSDRTILIGNICQNCSGNGIDNGGADCVLIGNVCYSNGTGGGTTEYQNGIHFLTDTGTANSDPDRCLVVANHCVSNPQYGLWLRNGANIVNLVVTGNNFVGNTTGEVNANDVTYDGVDGVWFSSTPTPASDTGTLTSASSAIEAKRSGHIAHVQGVITITTNGTGGGDIHVTLPYTSLVDCAVAAFRRDTGEALIGRVASGSAILIMKRYDNAYPGADGAVLVFGGSYEIS